MDALGGAVNGFLWWNHRLSASRRRKRTSRDQNCNASSKSAEASNGGGAGYRFPLKQAVTAGSLALTGDTIAQLTQRFRTRWNEDLPDDSDKDALKTLLSSHDWLRALRMTSYGFLLYGPGSYVWYQYLDHQLPQQTVRNVLLKVLLNQVILGPCVIAVVFAWNNLWLQKLSELPGKYREDFIPTLLNGFKFWIPVSAVNFWVVPLHARVAFMSSGSIFWNFVLSSTMSK